MTLKMLLLGLKTGVLIGVVMWIMDYERKVDEEN